MSDEQRVDASVLRDVLSVDHLIRQCEQRRWPYEVRMVYGILEGDGEQIFAPSGHEAVIEAPGGLEATARDDSPARALDKAMRAMAAMTDVH